MERVFQTVKAGSFTDKEIWDQGEVPTVDDEVVVSHPITVSEEIFQNRISHRQSQGKYGFKVKVPPMTISGPTGSYTTGGDWIQLV